jgi:hypothetical protein
VAFLIVWLEGIVLQRHVLYGACRFMKNDTMSFLTAVFWLARRVKYMDVFCKSCGSINLLGCDYTCCFSGGFFNLSGRTVVALKRGPKLKEKEFLL